MKKITDLERYSNTLPYASEIFGVYQPMLGWKSKRKEDRIKTVFQKEKASLLQSLTGNYKGALQLQFNADHEWMQAHLAPGAFAGYPKEVQYSSVLVRQLAAQLPDNNLPDDNKWKDLINYDRLKELLNTTVSAYYQQQYQESIAGVRRSAQLHDESPEQFLSRKQSLSLQLQASITSQMEQESLLAGVLTTLVEKGHYKELGDIFYAGQPQDVAARLEDIEKALKTDNPLHVFDPAKDIDQVNLSPIGIVHLFRQYFFEFDSFLGPSASHVWLSPGSTVELVEVSTRKTITEKIFETGIESSNKAERNTTNQDDFSDAVKEDNRNDTKVGIGATVNQSWVGGSASATASLNMETTQQKAREAAHKRMRNQSEKLSTEIRQNYKSTFKTITEATDTSSKRYTITNTTKDLINYELRRKMRQVGVQVQDIGTYLCWETFVDEPGKELGLADLVHIASPAEIQNPPGTELIPMPQDIDGPEVSFRWRWPFTSNVSQPNDPRFKDDTSFLLCGEIPVYPTKYGYILRYEHTYLEQVSGESWGFLHKPGHINKQPGKPDEVKSIFWGFRVPFEPGGMPGPPRDKSEFSFKLKLRFMPTPDFIEEVNTENKNRQQKIDNAKEKAALDNYYKAAQDRIRIASGIKKRNYEDLREEERIIVYRKLIGSLMTNTLYNNADSETRHVLSELINTIFDVDKMLYFVAPEWWKPRTHYHQFLGKKTDTANQPPKTLTPKVGVQLLKDRPSEKDTFSNDIIANWSDNEYRRDNYYITEDSQPAPLGSSLGWLLQLDGDNLRNTFLNSPWVKAVIPVRPGQEQAAINWLQQVKVEGATGLGAKYIAGDAEIDRIRQKLHIPADTAVSLLHAIQYLCIHVREKHEASITVGRFPEQEEIDDSNRVSATPIERVYEHGFYPLQNSFRINEPGNFVIFDQWVEVLPTDQVVPVKVDYDPVSGKMRNTAQTDPNP